MARFITSPSVWTRKLITPCVLGCWGPMLSSMSPPISMRRRTSLFSMSMVGTSSGLLIAAAPRSEEHTSELQSRLHLVCRLLLEKKKNELSTAAALGDTLHYDRASGVAPRSLASIGTDSKLPSLIEPRFQILPVLQSIASTASEL